MNEKISISDLNWKTWFMLITLLIAAGGAAYLGAKVSVDIDFDTRVIQALEQHVNSSVSYMEKPCSYMIGVLGTQYYSLNGTTGKLVEHSTNASAVINNAIGNSTGLVLLKAGNYTTSTTINIPDVVSLEGEGNSNSASKGTVLTLAPNANCDVINMVATGSHTFFSKISALTIVGNSAYESGTSWGIRCVSAHSDFLIDNVYVTDCLSGGIFIGNSSAWLTHIQNSWIENNKGDGLTFYNSNNAYVVNNAIKDNGGNGVNVTTSRQINFQGNEIVTNNKTGFYSVTSYFLVVDGNIIQSNGVYPVNTYYDIDLFSCTNTTFTGNILGGSTTTSYTLFNEGTIGVGAYVFTGNSFGYGVSGVYQNWGLQNEIKFSSNIGFVTENSGSSTNLANGATVNHGLAGTPTSVVVTSMNSTAIIVGVSAVAAGTFTVSLKDAAGAGVTGQSIYWVAIYVP